MPQTGKHSEGEMKPTSATSEPRSDLDENKPRGLAGLDIERRRQIAQLGGRAAHAQGKAHRYTREEAQAAGRIGGRMRAARAALRKQEGEAGSQAEAVRP